MTNEHGNPNQETPYEVGQGKPPKETQWQPGQSGNPRGRPRTPSLRELFLRVANVELRAADRIDKPRDITLLEAVMREMLLKGAHGNRFAAKQVLDLCKELLPEDRDGFELDDGEFVPAKMSPEREHDLTRFLGYDPNAPGAPARKAP
jgi:hypothetical protein